jgi:hypothetical protein
MQAGNCLLPPCGCRCSAAVLLLPPLLPALLRYCATAKEISADRLIV